MNWFKNFWKKREQLTLSQVFGMNGSIFWQDYDRRRVCGHIGRPREGDVVTCKMQSKQLGVFRITKVDWCGDPSNMWFADVKDVGYWVESV